MARPYTELRLTSSDSSVQCAVAVRHARSTMFSRKLYLLCVVILSACLLWAEPQAASSAASAATSATAIPAASVAPAFDVKASTDAYLATVPPDKKARSDAYF